MAANIPDVVKELCAKPVFAHLATLTRDGSPAGDAGLDRFRRIAHLDQHREKQDQGPEHAAR